MNRPNELRRPLDKDLLPAHLHDFTYSEYQSDVRRFTQANSYLTAPRKTNDFWGLVGLPGGLLEKFAEFNSCKMLE